MKKVKNKPRPFSWMNPKLEVRDTQKYGKGVFAKKDIKKEEMLFVMGGYILTIDDDNAGLSKEALDKPIDISDYFFIGPRNKKDLEMMPQHYVNHSCNPNAGFKGQIFMVAMRNIKKEEEIFYDYAMVMSPNDDSSSYFKIKCLCGSKNCREFITEDDWEISELQKKYNGHFQFYLQEKIDKNKVIKKKSNKPRVYQLKPAPWDIRR
jgi:hypothetical protein